MTVSYEAIRLWYNKFGSRYAQRLRRKHQGYGDTFFIDKVFVKIQGARHYLGCAVDQEGEVIDVFLQKRRDRKAAKRFLKHCCVNNKAYPVTLSLITYHLSLITYHLSAYQLISLSAYQLISYGVAHRGLVLKTINHSRYDAEL